MNIEIREATHDDLDTLKSFEQAIIAYERAFASNLKKDPISYYDLGRTIERNDTDVVVAVLNGKLIGSGYSQIRKSESFKKPEHYAYLGFMYVVPEHRGKGVNRSIIENLLMRAKQRGLTDVQLDVYAENDSALKAYAKIGFKPDMLKMRLSLED